MLGASVRARKTPDVPRKVSRGVQRGMRDAADIGYAVSQDEVPDGATSGLRLSGVEPTWTGGGLVWGYTSEYAENVERGTGPHYPPIEPLKLWARRVLGDEQAAWAVQETIGQEGTQAQPFVEPGYKAMVRELHNRGLGAAIRAEF